MPPHTVLWQDALWTEPLWVWEEAWVTVEGVGDDDGISSFGHFEAIYREGTIQLRNDKKEYI